MAGSEAEERIRAKAEEKLRRVFPTARIIHELMLQQGGCRIDLAAVTEDRLIVVEIKSERDVLKRLDEQYRQAKLVADSILVLLAEKHLDKARDISGWLNTCTENELDRFDFERYALQQPCNAPARLDMLWAEELRWVAGTDQRANRTFSILKASEYLTGGQVRKRVCAALRSRPFPRADAPIPLPFPIP